MICFAFNENGLRCMQLAGHEGVHAHAIEWGDDECWTPDTTVGPPQHADDGPSLSELHALAQGIGMPGDPLPEPIENCVICHHPPTRHSDDGCTVKNSEGDDCGCFEFV